MKELIRDFKTDITKLGEMILDPKYNSNPVAVGFIKEKKSTYEFVVGKLNRFIQMHEERMNTVKTDLTELCIDIRSCQTKSKSNKQDVLVAEKRCNEILRKLEGEYSDSETTEEPQ